MKSFSIVIFGLIAFFFVCSDANATNYYVATSGNDNNSGSQIPTDPTWPLIHALGRVETELRRIADALEEKHDTD